MAEDRQAVAAEALATSLQIANEWWRDRALRALAPLLSADQMAAALSAARALPTPGTRARSLARLAACVRGDARAVLAAEALAAGEALPEAADRARVAVLAVGSLPEEVRAEVARGALHGVAAIADPWERGFSLAELAIHLPEAGRLAALALVRAIDEAGARSNALAAMASRLPEHVEDEVLDEAISVAGGIVSGEARARALASTASALNPAQAEQIASTALAAAEAAGDEVLWGRVVRWVSTHLPASAHTALLARALHLDTPEARAEALPALAQRLPEPGKTEAAQAALAAIGLVADEWARVSALALLAPQLSTAAQPVALALAEGLSDGWARADALSALAGHLAPEPQAAAFNAALAAARGCANAWPRARALTTVAAHLPVR